MRHCLAIAPPLARLGAALIAISAIVAFALPGAAAGDTSPPLLIKNVRPVDARGGARPLTDVLIRDGRIAVIGKDIAAPINVTVMEGGGRFLAPGLWDMHVHFTYDARFTDLMADLFLDYGITSVRDTGGVLDLLLHVIQRMENSAAPTPRVFFAGPLLDGDPVVYDGDHAPLLGVENANADAARANVDRLAAAGVDFIKIYEMVSPEVFSALVDAASRHALPIAAHIPLSLTASTAGPQVQSMEHLRNIAMDCARDSEALLDARRARLTGPASSGYALRSELHGAQRDSAIGNEDTERCTAVLQALRNTIQVPTARLNAMTQFPPFANAAWEGALARLPTEVAADWARAPQLLDESAFAVLGQWTLQMLPRLRDAGVPVGAGTDTPIGWSVPGHSLHSELEIFVAAGLSTSEALESATVVPARFFGLDSELGLVAEGYLADLLLLEASPLADISNTRRIAAVIAGGRIARGQALIAR